MTGKEHPSTPGSQFLFVTCQVGAEGALKKELAQAYPHFKFAFSKPGFLTFKNLEGSLAWDFELRSVFARSYGVSLGFVPVTDLAAAVTQILDTANSIRQNMTEKEALCLHFWERDQYPPSEEPLGYVLGSWLGDLEARLRAADANVFSSSAEAELGDGVFQLIAIEPDRFALGVHLHSNFHSRWPGGRKLIALPPEAPSRAYLKLEEVLDWSGAPLRVQDIAVEIGSAPGGASFALLQRGLKVIGIDPGEMDPRVLKNPKFSHAQMPVNRVLRESLPERIDWLLLDMNVEPQITMYAVDRLVSRMKESLLGVILTLKLNTWKIADQIPYILDHVRAMGMVRVKAAQLSYHRQEIVIYGLTKKGTTRKGISRNEKRPKH